jgi:hypothetical protein
VTVYYVTEIMTMRRGDISKGFQVADSCVIEHKISKVIFVLNVNDAV